MSDYSVSHFDAKNRLAWVIAWLIWPLGALIYSIRQSNRKTLLFVLWLFCIYFGWVFIVPEDVQGAADAARYARDLRIMYAEQYSFAEFLSTLFDAETSRLDIYQPAVTWVIANFTDDPRWMFMVFAFVFGFFYIRNIQILTEKVPRFNTIYTIVFFIGVLLINPISNINGVRMWTAAHIFIYGVLLHIVLKRKYALLWIAGSCLVHFSFLLPFISFLIWKFIPKAVKPLFIVFVATAFVQEIDFGFVKETLLLLPDIFHGKVNSYYGDQYLETFDNDSTQRAIHVVANEVGKKLFIYIWVFVIYVYYKHISYHSKNIFLLVLILGAIANISGMLPSGGRFIILVEILLYYPIFEILVNLGNKKWTQFARFSTVPIVLFISAFSFRLGLEFTGIAAFISNPILGYYFNDQVPVINALKELVS